jgi:hypothetical protein
MSSSRSPTPMEEACLPSSSWTWGRCLTAA